MPTNINIKQYPLPELLDFYESVESIQWEHKEENSSIYNDAIQASTNNSASRTQDNIMHAAHDVQSQHTESERSTGSLDNTAVPVQKDSTILSINIEEIKRLAFEEGVQIAKAQYDTTEHALKRSAIQALTSIATKLPEIDTQLAGELRKMLHGCVELAMAIAHKVIGVTISTKATDIVITFLKKNLPLLYTEPLIEIKINELDFKQVEQYMQECIKDCSATNIRIVSSPNINQADCVIDFKHGTIIKDRVKMLEELGGILTHYLSSK